MAIYGKTHELFSLFMATFQLANCNSHYQRLHEDIPTPIPTPQGPHIQIARRRGIPGEMAQASEGFPRAMRRIYTSKISDRYNVPSGQVIWGL